MTTTEDLEVKILDLKKLAVARKREGNIDGAKAALIESKRLQVELDALKSHQRDQRDQLSSVKAATAVKASLHDSTPQDVPGDDDSKDDDQDNQDDHNDGDDDDLLDQLNDSKNTEDEDNDIDKLVADSPASFSLVEMMDLEMVIEFAREGMPIPSLEDYHTKIQEQKQAALAFKQGGKIKEAIHKMQCLKQLQTVLNALDPIVAGQNDETSGLQASAFLGDDGDSEEDKALLRELMIDQNEQYQAVEVFGSDANGSLETANACLDVDDLMNMDMSDIRGAFSIGMHFPSTQNIRKQVEEQKSLALKFKQAGDLETAKAALAKFKMWSQHLTAIENLIQEASNLEGFDGDEVKQQIPVSDIREEDLERLLVEEEKAPAPPLAKPPELSKPKSKSSEELRQEAIRLRDEKKIPQATAVLKLYKEALAREAEEAELMQRREIVRLLEAEIQKSHQQQDRFLFFQRLVDSTIGTQQLQAWWRYADLCSKVRSLIGSHGTKAVAITRHDKDEAPAGRLRLISEEGLTRHVRNAIDPMEERIEISIIDLLDLHCNKTFQSAYMARHRKEGTAIPNWLQLEAQVSIQLPLNESETDRPIDLSFRTEPFDLHKFLEVTQDAKKEGQQQNVGEPSLEEQWSRRGRVDFWPHSSESNPVSVFDGRQFVSLARGSSKFARTVLRRMERRKINIVLLCHTHENPLNSQKSKFGGWFGGGDKKAELKDASAPLHLGKIVLETKELLDHSCIAGEFSLLGNGKRPAGGKLRLSLRTGVPFDKSSVSDSDGMASALDQLTVYGDSLNFAVTKLQEKEDSS